MPAVRNIQAAKRPGPHPPCPGRIHTARQQGSNSKGEGNRQPHIAHVEQWRVDRQRGVLENGVQPLALKRDLMRRSNGLLVKMMNNRKATPIIP